MRVSTFELRLPFNGSHTREIAGEPQQQLLAKVDVGDFPSTKLYNGLHAVALFEKADRVILFEVVVMIVGVRAELQFLHLDDVLLLLGFVLFLFVLILPLAIVHRFRHGWLGGGSNDNQVQPHLLRFAHSNLGWQDLDSAVRENGPYFAGTNCLVHVFADTGLAGRETSGWIHS